MQFLSLLEKLDLVLLTLFALSGDNPDFNLIKEELKNEDIHEGEIRDCLLHLFREGFIYCELHGNRDHPYSDNISAHYLISFKGKYFFEKEGGYIKKLEKEKAELKNLETLENIRKRNEKGISQGTIYLAIGTFALVFVEALIHWPELVQRLKDFLHFIFP